MNLTGAEMVLFLIGQLIVGAGIWGGIRADIRNMHDQIRAAKEVAEHAHDRIDSIMGWNGNDRRGR